MNLLYIITLICLSTNVYATKLNYPRVLLPIFDKISINFTLEVIEKGCFKWTSSRNELIQLSPISDETEKCSSSVIVTVVSREKHRNTAIVLAENLATREVIRCDVILDVIDQLAVLTTTRELYLEEAPETFELYAQDSQGNAFTTLKGIEFNWKISTENNAKSKTENWKQVLQFLKFSESKYHEIPKMVEDIELLGLKGYMVLLEGSNTGSATVTVTLPYPEYSHVPKIEVSIMVLANILLDPSEANILVGDTIQFRVLQLKQGKLQEISLNSQYFLEIDNNDLATINGNSATGVMLGKTVVKLRDRNYVPNDKSSDTVKSLSPRSTLTVVQANKIALSLLPHNNWITVEEERHEIAIDLYTRDDQKITLGTKYKMNSAFDHNMFYELSKTKNGSRIYGEAIKAGKNLVSGKYERLHAENEMLIYKKLELKPILVILPYDPNFPTRHKIQFEATGGDGSYVWSSLNTQLATISQNGLVETKTENLKKIQNIEHTTNEENLGKLTQIKVSMVRNTIISKTADILFMVPVKLEIVHYNFETPLKDYVKIHVALYTLHNEKYLPFTLCDNLNFDLDFSNSIFVEDTTKTKDDKLEGDACIIFYLKATNIGTTNLNIAYKFNNKVLKDEVNLIVFDKLNIFNPISNEVVLPIGSSRNVIYKNGPTKVYSIDAELNKQISFENQIIDVKEFLSDYSKEKHVYNVLCKKVGETVLRFEMYNAINFQNHFPYVSSYETKVYCVKPRYINLYTTAKIKDGCPLQRRNSLMHVKSLENEVEIDIEILDENKRKLSNITSLILDWNLVAGDKVKGTTLKNHRETEEELIEGIPIPKRDYLKTTLTDRNINFQIKGIVTNYDLNILRNLGIKPETPHFGIQKGPRDSVVTPVIENELNFYAVDNTLLPFDSLSVYLTSHRTERVKISQGSGFYEIKLSEPGIITAEFDAKTRELIISAIKIGDVRIDVLDRCLMTEASHLYVSVVSMGAIEIEMIDRVEKSKSVEAIVTLFDSNDHPLNLESNNLQIYELSEDVFNPNMLSIKLGNQNNLKVGEVRYIVTGVELGETKIVFNAGQGERQIASDPAPIQVFPPLKLYPRNATLLIGSSAQIYSTGGPYPDVNIVYSIHHEDIAEMKSSVVTGLKLGETKVVGRCIGINPRNGNQIIFSEDSVLIRVIPLEKIKVKVPLVKIKSGSVMPAAIWAVPDISPMIVGTLDSLKIQWHTNQKDVIEINSIFEEAGIQYAEEDSISVHVKGLNPGKAQIHATVITSNGLKLKSTVEILVFKMLELEVPKNIYSDPIIIAPKTNIQLKSNLENTVYELENGDHHLQSVVKVTKSGNVISSDSIGRSLIIATSSDQTLPIPIEVKNIHYMLATLHSSNFKLNSIESKIPKGFNLLLRVSLHDNLGNEFSHNLDINNLNLKLSRKEMVDVHLGANFTVNLNLLRETSNMLSIGFKESAGIKYNEDFLKLSVGPSQHIFPINAIYSVGDIICFDSHVDSSSKWYSADESVLNINEETGVGQVISNRLKHGDKVSVYQGERYTGSLKFDLDLREADVIEFFEDYHIMSGDTHRVELVIKNHIQADKKTNLFSRNHTLCSAKLDSININFFSCKLLSRQQESNALLKHFRTLPIFDKLRGTYACNVNLLSNINELNSIIRNGEINFEVEAKLNNGLSRTATLKVVPGIAVSPSFISLDQLDKQGIIISGLEKILQKIVVESSDVSMFEVLQISKSTNAVNYKVKLLREPANGSKLYIKIYSPVTNQNFHIPILSAASPLQCATRPFNGNTLFVDFFDFISKFGIIMSCIFVLLATVAFVVFWATKSQPSENSVFISPRKGDLNKSQSIPGSTGMPVMFDRSEIIQTSSPYPQDPSLTYDDILLSPQRRTKRRFL